jgi:uncharacterized protein YjiK
MNARNASAKRIRLYGSLIAVLLSATIISEAVAHHSDLNSSRVEAGTQKKDKGKKKNKQEADARPAKTSRAFRGGIFEASGVAYVPGTDGVLFVDDGRTDEIFWMRLDAEGNQVGEIKPIKLGLRIEDPEDITCDGSRFYIVGSQNRTQTDETNALVRFSFDPQSQSVKNMESVGGLFQFLTSTVPELKGYAGKKGQIGSINIEGLAWDPVQGRLLLGLRDPQVGEQALVVPLKLRNPQAALSRQNLTLAAPNAIRLSLGGAGIRSIAYDERARAFQIISGAPEAKRRMDFRLWEWSGNAGQPPVEKLMLDSALKPEGITWASVGGRSFLFIVCDASKYMKIG